MGVPSGTDAATNKPRLKLPTPAELQNYVTRAVRPDAFGSRLYRATLPVAMGWWQEVEGDEKKFVNAIRRAAIAARSELAAIDGCKRPRPMKHVRGLWDEQETLLKADGALAVDLQPTTIWPTVA